MTITVSHDDYQHAYKSAASEVAKASVMAAYTVKVLQSEIETDHKFTKKRAFDFVVKTIDAIENGGAEPIGTAKAIIDEALAHPTRPFDRVIAHAARDLGLYYK